MNDELNRLKDRIEKMSKRVKETDKALEQLQAANNAIIASIVLAHGVVNEKGEFSLKIPRVDVEKILSAYQVSARVDGDMRVLIVSEREGAGKDEVHD